jgi:hydroxyacylglutathione hydrolase
LRVPWPWSTSKGKVPQISAAELKRWLDDGRLLQLVDARTGVEYRQGTLPGARHAPLVDMPASLQRLDLEPGEPVVVLCLSGHRSLPEARWLQARGYEAYSLQGGLLAWQKAGYELKQDPPAGQPGARRDRAG